MRIRYWSSDVCSSDLTAAIRPLTKMALPSKRFKGSNMMLAVRLRFTDRRGRWREGAERVISLCACPLIGFALLLLAWKLISLRIGDIPSPESTLLAAYELFKNPFYDNGPNDMGIGWNILASLGRVALGFMLAAAVGRAHV